jgi:hypothetical protein
VLEYEEFIWHGQDVTRGYNRVARFFSQCGCGTRDETKRFTDVGQPETLLDSLDSLETSSIEDLPDSVTIAVNSYGDGTGEMLVLSPITSR